MDEEFGEMIGGFPELLTQLCDAKPFNFDRRPPIIMPTSGVYLFSEGSNHMYVGRSNRLRKRYFLHTRAGSRHNQASFAYLLAREQHPEICDDPSHRPGRNGLAACAGFAEPFRAAKQRIGNMDYRYVEVKDHTRQALFEIYCSVALGTPYNDFQTH